jgi:hypothetical protein
MREAWTCLRPSRLRAARRSARAEDTETTSAWTDEVKAMLKENLP